MRIRLLLEYSVHDIFHNLLCVRPSDGLLRFLRLNPGVNPGLSQPAGLHIRLDHPHLPDHVLAGRRQPRLPLQ